MYVRSLLTGRTALDTPQHGLTAVTAQPNVAGSTGSVASAASVYSSQSSIASQGSQASSFSTTPGR